MTDTLKLCNGLKTGSCTTREVPDHIKTIDGDGVATGGYVFKDGTLTCTNPTSCDAVFNEEFSKRVTKLDCSKTADCAVTFHGVKPPKTVNGPIGALDISVWPDHKKQGFGSLKEVIGGSGAMKINLFKGTGSCKPSPPPEPKPTCPDPTCPKPPTKPTCPDPKNPTCPPPKPTCPDPKNPNCPTKPKPPPKPTCVDGLGCCASNYEFEYIEKKFDEMDTCVQAFFTETTDGHTDKYIACMPGDGKNLDCEAASGSSGSQKCKVPVFKVDTKTKTYGDDYLWVNTTGAGGVKQQVLDVKNLTGHCEPGQNGATECFAKLSKRSVAQAEYRARKAKETAELLTN